MANIQPDINKIAEAIYGEEVRGSIVHALTNMNIQAEAAQVWATGSNVNPDDPSYVPPSAENSAKGYAEAAEAAQEAAEDAQEAAEAAQGAAETAETNAEASATNAGNSESAAGASASAAALSESAANADALKAEGHAVGTQNGTPVTSGTYYHNNAAYWSAQAMETAQTVTAEAIGDWLDAHPTALSDAVVQEKLSKYATVANMQADTSLLAGQIVVTMGYTARGDNGGCAYYISDTQVSGAYNILLSNGKYAAAILPDAITPQMFGAVGDSVADDTSAVQTALKNASGKRYLFVPNGTYKITNQLEMPSSITIVGETMVGTIFYFVPNTTDDVFMLNVANATYANGITLRNVTLRGYKDFDTTPASGQLHTYGLRIAGLADGSMRYKNITIDSCGIEGFTVSGLAIASAENVSITNCSFTGNNTNAIAFTRGINNVNVSSNHFRDNLYHNISVEDPNTTRKVSNVIIANNDVSYSDGNSGRTCVNLFVTNPTAEEIKHSSIKIVNNVLTGAIKVINFNFADDVLISGNTIKPASNVQAYGVYVKNQANQGVTSSMLSANIVISGNTIIDPYEGIDIAHGTRIQIADNIILNARYSGIYVHNETDTASEQVCVQNNALKNCQFSIYMVNIDGLVISGNEIKNATEFAIRVGGSAKNALVTSNNIDTVQQLLTHTSIVGISIMHTPVKSKNTTIVGNVIKDVKHGVSMTASSAENEGANYAVIKSNRFVSEDVAMEACVYYNRNISYTIIEDNVIPAGVAVYASRVSGGTPITIDNVYVRNNGGFADATPSAAD